MRRLALASFVVLTAACNPIQMLPAAPTSVATAAPIAQLTLLGAAPDRVSGVAHLGVLAVAANGAAASGDVSCRTTSGALLPARFDPRTHPVLELGATSVPARVTCDAGDVHASVDVDMSAWWMVLSANQYVSTGDGAGQSRISILPERRIAGIDATRVQLDWGDGAIETLPYVPASTIATRFHAYRRSGYYVITGRIEWPGGAHEARLSIAGGPPGSQP